MTWRRVVASLCAALLVCAVSWAAVCPLCLRQIPDGERYCARCKAQMLAEKLTVGEEQKLADDAMRARPPTRPSSRRWRPITKAAATRSA